MTQALGVAEKNTPESGLRDINSENVRSLFDVSDNFIKEDWEEWINKTSLELLTKSPSVVLHSCSVTIPDESFFKKQNKLV